MKPNVTVILGPTASGKTQYGIDVAKEQDGAIISADSRQVYTGMNIGTAKPEAAWSDTTHDILTPDVVEGVDHYLFNIRTPDSPITLLGWQSAATQAIAHILAQNKHPVIVGGTMLYIDSIVKNYLIPEVPPNHKFRQELEPIDTSQLYDRLVSEDPKAREYIDPNNKRRIIRALEVMNATDQPFSTLRIQRPSPYTFELIGLFPGWEEMKQRITKRHTTMFNEGLIQETQKLQHQYGSTLPLLQTMNYKQAVQIIDSKASPTDALAENIRINMRYARRQISWWRGRDDITWIGTKPE